MSSTPPTPTTPLSIPPELKAITPFVRRAEELDKESSSSNSSRPESRLVAYYCRQYAVRQGIALAQGHAAATACLGTLLQVLETEKPHMDTFTRPEAEFVCRQFAYGVFDKADGDDRSGQATKTTAKTFYTAASFLQMLQQFYPESNDVATEEQTNHMQEDKKRALYAKWKATDILKALKEGRTPQAGGYGEQEPDLPDDDDEKDQTEKANKETTPVTIPPSSTTEPSTTPTSTPAVAPPPPPTTATTTTATTDDVLPPPPAYPMPPPPAAVDSNPTAPEPNQVETVFRDDDDDDDDEEQGTEVVSDLPPSYPAGGANAFPPPAPTHSLPAVVAPPPAPPAKKPTTNNNNSGGWFGGGRSNKKKISHKKAHITDATELTRFAMAALEDKQPELAAERLQQALDALYQG